MFKSKDGKSFGSAYVAKRRDDEHAKSLPMGETKEAPRTNPMGEAKTSSNEATAPDNDVKANPENVDPHQIVAQHGKAHTIHVAHDHKAKKHHVMSTHEDGHVQESEHASPKDAHDAAAVLAGAGSDQPAGSENPEMEAPEADGFSMPKLA